MPPPPPFGRSPSPASRGRIKQSRPRGAFERPSFAHHQPSVRKQRNKKKGGEAPKDALFANCRLRGSATLDERRARLPALRHGTRHRLSPRWLSPRPGFPQRRGGTVFCRHAAKLSCVKHAPCGPVLLPADRCPRAARERFARPRAGIRTRSAVKIASGMRPSVSEFVALCIVNRDICQYSSPYTGHNEIVGWVERSENPSLSERPMNAEVMGFAAAQPILRAERKVCGRTRRPTGSQHGLPGQAHGCPV